MTPTPRTDAEWQSITASAPWDAAADQMANLARKLEREITQWQSELSKVMPPDFKDWWHNSKTEWPLVARLVIEGKNRNAELDSASCKELERELADWKVLQASTQARLEQAERDIAAERALADSLADGLAV